VLEMVQDIEEFHENPRQYHVCQLAPNSMGPGESVVSLIFLEFKLTDFSYSFFLVLLTIEKVCNFSRLGCSRPLVGCAHDRRYWRSAGPGLAGVTSSLHDADNEPLLLYATGSWKKTVPINSQLAALASIS
jgi:hypothetical protein